MPTHAEKRILPYSRAQLFDLVADCDRYPEFLPWCVAARTRGREGNVAFVDMMIGYKMIRESFTSRNELNRPERIDITYHQGPFRYLNNHWIFEELPDGRCLIDFYVDFEFRNRVLRKVIGALFNEAVRRMISAFDKRAHDLYGEPRAQPTTATAPQSGRATATSPASRPGR